MDPIGILHPGEMGISVAASAQRSGHTVYWASEGRSAQTRSRAEKHALVDAGTLAGLCGHCKVILSVCPPHAAEQVAKDVLAHGFRGLYVDANAISPERARHIGQMMVSGGADFVDGGIIGGPAWQSNSTWLHLSGEQANTIASLFAGGSLETNVLGKQIGDASALKMCFAAYTKGRTALLCAILGASEALAVRHALEEQWIRSGFDLAQEAPERARRVTARAWRFAGEMEEIAATFESAGMPGGFHQAAGEIYRRLERFKDAPVVPSLDEVLAALIMETHKQASANPDTLPEGPYGYTDRRTV
jgi:3-hydroxyisobutyrate dehydrogenase-like beta-hydroxyacid dehydrogenase